MRKSFILLIAITLLSTVTFAQNYNTGLGVRLGFFNGITVKHFLSENNALEGIASFRWDGFVITGLYEWQKGISGAPGLDYELGIGAHVGAFDGDNLNWHDNDPFDDNITIVGVDLLAGLEYTFAEVPINLGLDWKPAFNFGKYNRWWGDGLALSIRYAFK